MTANSVLKKLFLRLGDSMREWDKGLEPLDLGHEFSKP